MTAIIPTFRRWSCLQETVRHLNTQTDPPDQIVIVDQTPREELPPGQPGRLVAGSRVPLLYEYQAEPLVSRARNRAAQLAAGPLLLYLDDDVVLEPDLVKQHRRHYAEQGVDAVVGCVVGAFGARTVPVPDGFERLGPEGQAFLYCERFARPLARVAFMYAGNFSIRRRVLAALGGWDEHVITYGDRDLGLRLAKAGYRMDYDPRARLVHLALPSGGTRLSDGASPWRAWERCVSIHLLAWRHLRRLPLFFLRFGLWRAARCSVLLRRNVMRPWRWPAESWGYLKGLAVGRRWAREGVRCSFPLEGADL